MAENEKMTTNSIQVQRPPDLLRKFELAVYEEDVKDDGTVKWNQVSYKQPVIVEAKNPAELNEKLNLYKQCGQMARVVREIDPPSKEQLEAYKELAQQNKAQDTKQAQVQIQQNQVIQTQAANMQQAEQMQRLTKNAASKPKYYKVGNIEIKDDAGKIYQKQWMKLSDSEASNIRLINDRNNALVNLNGKHFEMKRWVLVDTSTEDESEQLEEILK